MPPSLSSLPPPPQGQTGVTLSSLKSLPPPPTGQQGMTLAQVQSQPQAQPQAVPSMADQIWKQLVGGIGKVGAGINEAKPVGGTGGFGGLVEGVGKILGGTTEAITSPIAPLTAPIGAAIDTATQPIQRNTAVQKFAMSGPGETTSRVASTIADYANAAGLIAGGIKAPSAATDVTTAVKNAVTETPEQVAARTAADTAATQAQTQAVITRGTQDWLKPTLDNTAAFNKARQVLSQSPNAPAFLAQQKLSPFTMIENGRYATEDTAQALRDTAGQMSSDTLRPSLQMADYTTPKTPVSEIQSAAIKQVQSTKGITAADTNTAIDNINTEAAALKAKYPDGMSLTNMHDEKITYSKNGGYSPIKSASDNIKATANRDLGVALGDKVEAKAPPTVPVHDANAYFSQYYKAADYLDALNTKKAPVSALQYIAHKGAQVFGAGVGHAVGGGILGGVGGYLIGGALEHALENITGPMRASFISNLEITHPEVMNQIEQYLQNQASGNTGVPRLPVGSFIAPPAPSEATQMTGRAAQLTPK